MLKHIYSLFLPAEEPPDATTFTVQSFVLLCQFLYHILSICIFGTMLNQVVFPTDLYVVVLFVAYIGIYYFIFSLYEQRLKETSKSCFYIATNIFIFIFSSTLGNKAGIYLLYFPLITSTLIVYGFHDKEKIILMTALSFAFLGLLDFTEHRLWLLTINTDTQHGFYAVNFVLSVGLIGFFIIYLINVLYHTKTRLQESEDHLSSILSSLNEVVWAVTLPEHDILYLNAAAEQVFAFPQKIFYENKKYWSQMVWHEDKTDYDSFEAEVYKKGSDEIEYRVVRRNGELRWLRDRCRIIWDEQERPLRMEGITTDITERKLAEEKIKQQNEQLQGILESTHSSIFAVDTELNYLTYNSNHSENMRLNYGVDVAKGINVIEGDHFGEDTDAVYKHLQRALAGEQFSITEEMGGIYRSWYETIYNPIEDEFGKVTGVAVFSHDITERKEAENEILRTNFELDTFVYRASHDMRAPLRSVMGLISLIHMEPNPENQKEYLKLIEKSVDNLDTFFEDLLSYSKNSRLDLSCEVVDFKKLVKHSWESLQYMSNIEKIRFSKSIDVQHPFYSDMFRIETILQNLLSNAIKYHTYTTQSFIKVHIVSDCEQVQMIVEDNGKGIEADYLPKVFDMFFRASLGTYGSGLGLYITRQIVEKLGGSIHIESTYKAGTRVTVTIPNLAPSLMFMPQMLNIPNKAVPL